MGSNSMYVSMAWIMAGFLIMAVFRGGAPELTRPRQRLPLLAGWSVGMALWLWFLFDVLIGAVNGHAWELTGVGSLTIFAMALVTGAFTRTFGLAAIVPVMLGGVPASGGGLSVYFDGHVVGGNLLVIVVWGVVGVLLNLAADRWVAHRAKRHGDVTTIPAGTGVPQPAVTV
ncbi:hypothetical protein [Rhodococcus sp. X156]|uniref:hypothetical protein n=1 Tax=Rhodococcus sp. X156 TaxID=2499145 RepID=UPI0019D0C66F|nr:hypothetical protein [Rhodococcus sp. X156]